MRLWLLLREENWGRTTILFRWVEMMLGRFYSKKHKYKGIPYIMKSNKVMISSFDRSTNMVAPGEDASQAGEIID